MRRLLPCLILLTQAAVAQGPPAEPLELERDGRFYRCEPQLVEDDYFKRFDRLIVYLVEEIDGSLVETIIGELELESAGTPLGTGLQTRDLDGDCESELVVWTYGGGDLTAESGLVLVRPGPDGLTTLFESYTGGALPLDLDNDAIFEVLCFVNFAPAPREGIARIEFANQIWALHADAYYPARLTDYPDLYLDMADSHGDQLLSLSAAPEVAPGALAHHAAGVLIHLALGEFDDDYAATWERYDEELRPLITGGDGEAWTELEAFFGDGAENVRSKLIPETPTALSLVDSVEFLCDCGYYRVDAFGEAPGSFSVLELHYIDDSCQDFVEWGLIDTFELEGPGGRSLRIEDVDENGRPDVIVETAIDTAVDQTDDGKPLPLVLFVGLDGFSLP